MGVKSTKHLSRKEAEEKYIDLKIKLDKVRRKYLSEAVLLDDQELEDILETLNDKASSSGEGFENYTIDN